MQKKGAGANPKFPAPAPAQILNRLRLQPKNLDSDWLRNTAYLVIEKAGYLAKYAAASLQTEASNFLLENVNMLFITKNKIRVYEACKDVLY